MPSTPVITRKSLLVGAGLGLVALAAGCAKAPAGSSSSTAEPSGAAKAWGYEGAEGPENWGALSSAFQSCKTGTAQSPVDIPAAAGLSSQPISLSYSASDCEVSNSGHSAELRSLAAQAITVGGVRYTFRQMHFHSPSEHTLAGVRYESEFHFVHESDDGRLAVLGVLAKAGLRNVAWSTFIDAASAREPGTTSRTGAIDLQSLFPASLDHYAYEGSLTTPPCSENVHWLVLQTPIELGTDQITKLKAKHSNNNRPTQPLNDREILLVKQ
jgi:carbonic anhydrase